MRFFLQESARPAEWLLQHGIALGPVAALEERMDRAMRIVSIARAMRMKSNLKVRQPLQKIIVPISSEEQKQSIVTMQDMIMDEINVKAIEFVHDESDIVRKKAKPNFRSLGQKYGKNVQIVAAKVREMTGAEITLLQRNGSLVCELGGVSYRIALEDIEETDGTVTVALDTEMTPELISEGFAREFVNRIQNMRKDAGFEVTDRIVISYTGSAAIVSALDHLHKYVMSETLAASLTNGLVAAEYSGKDLINGEPCEISIGRV